MFAPPVRIQHKGSELCVVPAQHFCHVFAGAVYRICSDPATRPEAIAVELGPATAAEARAWLGELGVGTGDLSPLPVMLGLVRRNRMIRPSLRQEAMRLQEETGKDLNEMPSEVLHQRLGFSDHAVLFLSPVDSIVEAIRSSLELGVPAHGVDLEETADGMHRNAAIQAGTRWQPRKRTVVFEGSVLDGIDVKSTLRAFSRGKDRVYVRDFTRDAEAKTANPIDGFPVVWILSPGEHPYAQWKVLHEPSRFIEGHVRDPLALRRTVQMHGEKMVAAIGYGHSKSIDGRALGGQEFRVDYFRGILLFQPLFWTNRQFARWAEMTGYRRNPFCQDADLDRYAQSDLKHFYEHKYRLRFGEHDWVTSLILMALPFSREFLTVVLPGDCRIEPIVHERARKCGVRITTAPLNLFPDPLVSRLAACHLVPAISVEPETEYPLTHIVPQIPDPIMPFDLSPLQTLLEKVWKVALEKNHKALQKRASAPLFRWYEHHRRYEDARGVLKRLVEVYVEEGDRSDEAVATNNLAFEYYLEGRVHEAIPGFQAAARLFEALGETVQQANSLANSWMCGMAGGDLADAGQDECELQRLAEMLSQAGSWQVRKPLIVLARIAEREGNIEYATALVKRAIEACAGNNTRYPEMDAEYLRQLECMRARI